MSIYSDLLITTRNNYSLLDVYPRTNTNNLFLQNVVHHNFPQGPLYVRRRGHILSL